MRFIKLLSTAALGCVLFAANVCGVAQNPGLATRIKSVSSLPGSCNAGGGNADFLILAGTGPEWCNAGTYSVVGGGVTSFTGDGALITNSVSVGAVTITLGNAGAHEYWGNNTGSTAAPSYVQPSAADLSNGTTGSGAVVLAGSPALTGTPTAPTPSSSDNSTKIATTAFVQGFAPGGGSSLTLQTDGSNNSTQALLNLSQGPGISLSESSGTVTVKASGFSWGGDGSDGSVTFDGTSTVLGLSPSSSTYTLTRNIYTSSMTVNSGVSIKTGNYAIFCTGTLTVNGTIRNNGTNGGAGNSGLNSLGGSGNGTSGTPSENIGDNHFPGGSMGEGNQIAGSGANGGTGAGSQAGAPAAGASTNAVVNGGSTGNSGGAGGAGGSGNGGANAGGASRSGGAGGTAPNGTGATGVPGNGRDPVTPLKPVGLRFSGGFMSFAVIGPPNGFPGASAGGSSGGGDGTNSGGGGGGAGSRGGNGGFIGIFARQIIVGSSGTISAIGGNGGNAGNGGTPSAGNCGGGGGGGGGDGGNGGVIWLIYQSLSNSGSITAAGGSGGTAGSGGGKTGTGVVGNSGSSGNNGLTGALVQIQN